MTWTQADLAKKPEGGRWGVWVLGTGFRVLGLGVYVGLTKGSGFGAQGFGFRVLGSGSGECYGSSAQGYGDYDQGSRLWAISCCSIVMQGLYSIGG